jgi:hypothetical protein
MAGKSGGRGSGKRGRGTAAKSGVRGKRAAKQTSASKRRDDDAPGVLSRLSAMVAAACRAAAAGVALAWRNLSTTVFVLAVLAVAAGWVFGRGWLEERVAETRGGAFDVRVSVADAPWSPGALNELGLFPAAFAKDVTHALVDPSPFDRASLDRASAALASSGWFAEPPVVRREPAGWVTVAGEWRAPKAIVERRGELYLVDADGRVLFMPPSWLPSDRLVRVLNPAQAAPRDANGEIAWGSAWPGGGVHAAIELATYLRSRDVDARETGQPMVFDRLIGVDLSRWSSTAAGHLLLRTDRGGVVVWGAPLGEPAGHEAPAEVKLRQLRQALALDTRDRWDAIGGQISVNQPVMFIDRPIGSGEANGG